MMMITSNGAAGLATS